MELIPLTLSSNKLPCICYNHKYFITIGAYHISIFTHDEIVKDITIHDSGDIYVFYLNKKIVKYDGINAYIKNMLNEVNEMANTQIMMLKSENVKELEDNWNDLPN